jgi:hypothetical protein
VVCGLSVLANATETAIRDGVLGRVLDCIRADRKILLPPLGSPSKSDFALHDLGENEFRGEVGAYRYQFEGEDDLLHLIVTRMDASKLTVEEGREVASFVLVGVPAAVVWLKPGEFSQHFYLGHDELLTK